MKGRDEGNIPEIDKELKRLRELGIIEKSFLSGLYSDLYGDGNGNAPTPGADPAGAGSGKADDWTSAVNDLWNESAPHRPAQGNAGNLPGGAGSFIDPAGTAGEAGPSVSPVNPPAGAGSFADPANGPGGTGSFINPANVPGEGNPALNAEGDSAAAAAQSLPAEEEKQPEEDPRETLDNLVGLTKIKADVRELTDFVRIQKMRKDAGLKSVPVSLHLVFTGNPGTGKTTVARIISKLYKEIGVLSKGQLVEVDRSGLVAGYVGQTALKVQEQIQKALGGGLFIDEAYALAQKDDAFGQEAIDTILKAMEDHRDNLVVIVAGYTKPMKKFIESNPGLKSRFNKYIEFPDYSVDELVAIFDLNCKKYDYTVEEDAKKHIREMIVLRKLEKTENFANAREVRNLFEEIITNQARRVAALENPTQEDMMMITMDDLTEEDPEAVSSGSPAAEEKNAEETGEAEKAPEEFPKPAAEEPEKAAEEEKEAKDAPEAGEGHSEEEKEPDQKSEKGDPDARKSGTVKVKFKRKTDESGEEEKG